MIPARIAGIPCLIEVTEFVTVPPWSGPASTAPSEMDFCGYNEIEYIVCDRRGRPAPWLEEKISQQDRVDIEDKITGEKT